MNLENQKQTAERDPAETPRSGVLGAWDRLVGPGATTAEQSLVLSYGLLFTVGVLGYANLRSLGWTPLQQVLVAFLALDIAGGIVANTTASGTRWWHRPGQRPHDHFGFVALHLYPFALALLFESASWTEATLVYGYLLVGSAFVLLSPRSLRRPIAMLSTSLGILVAVTVVSLGPGLEWFVPFLYIKLLGGHLASE
ncbi:hypothetical protein ACH9L7_18700 (plasmid) [Haloferax sp. S1W]|uniref:hypothetical protein n=1 Tax=Haloferax sp. S1W TaxID=3377110 RepID=UPI0037C91637